MKWFRLMCLAAVAGQLVGSGAAADRAAANPEGTGSTPKLPPSCGRPNRRIAGRSRCPALRSPRPSRPSPCQTVAPALPPAAKLAPTARGNWWKMPSCASLLAPAGRRRRPAPSRLRSRKLDARSPPTAKSRSDTGRKATPANCSANPSATGRPTTKSKAVNGTIYAFDDPTSKYKELELDFDQQVRHPAHRVRLSAAPHLAGMPPSVEWPGRRRRRRPGPQILFLHQPPPGRAGRPRGQSHQPRLVLIKKPKPAQPPRAYNKLGVHRVRIWAYSVAIRSFRTMKLRFRVPVAVLAAISLLPVGAFAGDKKKKTPRKSAIATSARV